LAAAVFKAGRRVPLAKEFVRFLVGEGWLEDGELRLSTRRQALARARRIIRESIPSDEDLTQSLIDDRRAEAARE
jgi:hypothetical protein